MVIDIQQLLQPVSRERPAGIEARDDPRFAVLTTVEHDKKIVDGREEVFEKPINWRERLNNALAIAQESRDLRLYVLIVQALLMTEGARGLAQGLSLLRGSLEQFWDSVYPELDLDARLPSAAAMRRLNAIRGLVDQDTPTRSAAPESLLKQLRALPLVIVRGQPAPLILATLPSVALRPGPADPPLTMPNSSADLQRARAEWSAISDLIEGRIGQGQAHDLRPLAQILDALLAALEPYDMAPEPPPAQVGAPPTPISAVQLPATHSQRTDFREGGMDGRDDVMAALTRIIGYYEAHEPASPVPILLRRARRMVSMTFEEAIAELVPEAADKIREIGGTKSAD